MAEIGYDKHKAVGYEEHKQISQPGKKYKVIYDRKGCIGAAACAAVCPKYWEMNSDGKADLVGATSSDGGDTYELEISETDLKENIDAALACNKDAAESCPVNVIKIVDMKTGNDIV